MARLTLPRRQPAPAVGRNDVGTQCYWRGGPPRPPLSHPRDGERGEPPEMSAGRGAPRMWPRSRSARARRTDLTTRTDSGFSLIELMVVVLIISILVVIALPVFAGARDRAADKAAESNLRNALPAAVSYYVDTS